MSSGEPETGSSPAGPAKTIYLLVFNDPDQPASGYGLGWTVAAWDGSTPRWSVSLTGRGAGAHTEPRVAKAVAVRVLGEHGVQVAGWYDGDARGPAMFRALAESSSPAAALAPGDRHRATPADPAADPMPIPAQPHPSRRRTHSWQQS